MRKPVGLVIALALLTAMLATLASCEHRKYEIVMSSHSDKLERKLTAQLVSDSNAAFPVDEIAAIEKLYPAHEANADGKRYVFTGTFAGRTPNDIGGAGFHACIETPVGSLTAYVERFRGNDDIADQMEARTKAADRLVDLLGGWLKTQVGGEKDYAKLQAFLDKDVRHDLKNLSLYLWMMANDLARAEYTASESAGNAPASQPALAGAATAGAAIAAPATPPPASQPVEHVQQATPEKAREDAAMRVCQYLMEKGYLQPKDAALAYKFLNAGSEEKMKDEVLAAFVAKVLKDKGGIENRDLIQKIAGYCMPGTPLNKDADISMREYLRQTDEYKKTLAEWKAGPGKDPNNAEPDSWSVLSDLATTCIEFGSLGPDENDQLTIKLPCPAEPLYTNADAGVEPNTLCWSRIIQKAGKTAGRLPTLCYAVWAAPNIEFQTKHFGGAVLSGQRLMEYCLWHQGLSAKEAAEWDAMVAKLAPGPALAQTVRAFQFSTHPAPPTAQTQPQEGEKDFYQVGKTLVLNAVGAPTTQPASQPASAGSAIYKPLLSGSPATGQGAAEGK